MPITTTDRSRGETRVVDAARVDHVLAHLPNDALLDDLAGVLRLVSGPSRLRLLSSQLEGGEVCVCDLAVASLEHARRDHG